MSEQTTTFPAALAVRVALGLSAVVFVVGIGLYGLAAAQLVWTEIGGGSAELSFGRLFPTATNALLFGWLTLALFGVVFYALPRLTGAPLAFPWLAAGSALVAAGGAVAGTLVLAAGESAGGRWLEYPTAVDIALLVAYLAAAVVTTTTVRRSGDGGLPVAAWYLLAAPWWLVLSHATGAVPGLEGLAAELQAGFVGTALMGLWVVCGAVGAAYFAVMRSLPEAGFNDRLGRIGFWSLALTWAWTSGRLVQYGPTNDWVETIPVLFTAGLVVAALTVAADFAHALRGRWSEVKSSGPLQLVVAGVAFLVIAPPIAFVGSLRSVSAVTGFTAWQTGFDDAVLLGAGGLLVLAGAMSVVSASRPWGRWWGRAVLWPVAVGVGVAVVSRLGSGLQQGYGWLAGVQSGAHENTGEGFAHTMAPLEGLDRLHAIGLGLALMGALAFLLRLAWLIGRKGDSGAAPAVPVEGPSRRTVLRGAVALFSVAALGTFIFPAADSTVEPSMLADETRDLPAGSSAALGRQVYVAEGCWYCHTQQVRSVVTDVGLGRVSVAGDYAHDPDPLAGNRRIGPDLAHYGSRTGDPQAFAAALRDPRSMRSWSIMPAYGYLTDAEISALYDYLSGLE